MAADATIRVRGLRDLQRAFKNADRTLGRELRSNLREAADPVRADAESLAESEVRNIGPAWSRMRVGVTQTLVYVAPRQRGVKARGMFAKRRPNLAPLLMDRAMQPALERNVGEVVERINDALEKVERNF